MSEKTQTPFRSATGEGGEPVTGRICKPPGGQAGRDHPDQQGQVFAALETMPAMLGQANPQPGHIVGPDPRGPVGRSYHDRWLDEMTCYGVRFADGSINWLGLHGQWDEGETPQGGMGGATGKPTYVSRGEKGK